MVVTGPPEWRPTRWLPVAVAVVFALQAAQRLVAPDRGLFDVLVGLASLALAAVAVLVQVPRRVRVDDRGVHVRGRGWRTVDVAWDEVTDIEPGPRPARGPAGRAHR